MKKINIITILVSLALLYTSNSSAQNKTLGTLSYELSQLYQLNTLPQYREGAVKSLSSYDRNWGNSDGDYIFLRDEGNKHVLGDLKGAGVICRIWTPVPTTDTIQFYIDGESTPSISMPFIDLFSGKEKPFTHPLCDNEVGGYYCYYPIQYSKSCKIMYLGKKMAYLQIEYRPYPKGTHVERYTPQLNEEEQSILNEASAAWNRNNSPIDQLKKDGENVLQKTIHFSLNPGDSINFFQATQGGRIVGFELNAGDGFTGKYKDILLQAQWDNDEHAAINCPVADFFGYAFGKPAMRSILIGSKEQMNYCYLPMPYQNKAQMSLIYKTRKNTTQKNVMVSATVYYENIPQNAKTEGKLYTVWNSSATTTGIPHTFANVNDKGHYIGTILSAQGLKPGMTGFFEGDDSTSVDGQMTIHGTGSEDYFNGGWYALLDRWDRGVSMPIHGSLDYSIPLARTGGYRFFLSDKMSFQHSLNTSIQHGGDFNNEPGIYTSVAFYYGSKPCTDVSNPLQAELRTVYESTNHIFYPQLMQVTPDGDSTSITYVRWRYLIAKVKDDGIVRIMLNDVPEGTYELSMTYYKQAQGAEFSVWNRQKMISDWKDTKGLKEEEMTKQSMGTITITPQTNSITIQIRKTATGNLFQFQNIYLDKK